MTTGANVESTFVAPTFRATECRQYLGKYMPILLGRCSLFLCG